MQEFHYGVHHTATETTSASCEALHRHRIEYRKR